jgi:hypothetical protein
MDIYNQIVSAACEAATMAVLRAMRSGNRSRSRGIPASPNRSSLEGIEPETGVLKPFERMCPRALTDLHCHKDS